MTLDQAEKIIPFSKGQFERISSPSPSAAQSRLSIHIFTSAFERGREKLNGMQIEILACKFISYRTSTQENAHLAIVKYLKSAAIHSYSCFDLSAVHTIVQSFFFISLFIAQFIS